MKKIWRYIAVAALWFVSIPAAAQVSFTSGNLAGTSLNHPTSLQFGPDGRLYVAQQDGKIVAYTVVRNGAGSYQVTATETILLVQQIPNHNDDGSLNAAVNTRQVTGILVSGTAASPVLYVTSSDPRIGGGNLGLGNNKNLDTNSGVISRLTRNGSSWVKVDLVRGLPRSEENHSTNGMQLDEVNHILYVCQGGNTDMGAPSNNFVFLPEYAYGSAILTVDLNAIGNTTYDLPTLDDEDKPNTSSVPGYTDNTDPFGGNNGKNQAMLTVGSPVQVYSTGWRNHYDLVITENGRMYSFDNGPNYGWGGIPDSCSNTPVEPGAFLCDVLHFVPGPGYYAGHPNPTRGNRANTFNATNPQSPVPAGMEDPVECTYISAGNEAHALTTICSSTNGMDEYTASNFAGAMKGDLLAAAFNGKLYRFKLNAAGDAILSGGQTVFASNFGSTPLDLTAQGDNDIFPGTVWAANYNSHDITVFEPADYHETPDSVPAIYNNADPINGGRMFDQFWADETDFVGPVDPSVNMLNVTNYANFYRCRSCHAWDREGRYASYIDRAPKVNRPKVAWVNIADSIPTMSIVDLFEEVKHAGGALVDTARTADGTNSALGGNQMPDFSKLLTDQQIWDIVKFLKEAAFNTEELYDITTSGVYPNGLKSFSNIGKDGDAAAGVVFYNTKCKGCHGLNGRDGSLSNGNGGTINEDIGKSIGEFARTNPYELQHKVKYGNLGSIMHGVSSATIQDIKNLLKALSDKNAYPDLSPVWYADADSDSYGNPWDTVMSYNAPAGYVANGDDCDDHNAAVHPGAQEIEDGADNNCDGEIDEGFGYGFVLHINAGGPQYISAAGDTFVADRYYSTPSSVYSNMAVADIANTDDDLIYKTERYGNFSYNIPVDPGTYEVRLYFAEIWNRGQTPGVRVFNVAMEGSTVLSNYDIYSQGGGYAAVVDTFSVVVLDGELNISFSPIANNAKVSAVSVLMTENALDAFANADPINGGRLYDQFWAVETDFVTPVNPAIDMVHITGYPNFYKCRSCHGWDQKGREGAYIDRASKTNRPNVAHGITSFVSNNSVFSLFDAIKNSGGAAVDPARTADGTNPALGGDAHPDYGQILNDSQIWDIVKFLKEKALNTEELYDLSTTGIYPTGPKSFSNLGKDGDAIAGAAFFSQNCSPCHGANGRDDAYFTEVGAIGQLARRMPYEVQHKAVFGSLGSSMRGINDADIQDIKNLLKALSDPVAFPDELTDTIQVWYADADGDSYGNPNDTLMAVAAPAGYVSNGDDCNDALFTVHPGAAEISDGLDNDCNGLVDDGLSAPGPGIFINAGGPQYIASNGDTFQADWYYISPSYTYSNNSIPDIHGTDDDALYKTERWAANLSYNIPVPNGTYSIQLYFAEIYFGATGGKTYLGAGSRIFDISIEGATILPGYDIYTDAGAESAVVKTFDNINITDGEINLALHAVVNNAKLSAIGILPATPVVTDCHGDVNGTAAFDDCGVCAGGNTGVVPNSAKDCNGVCFGTAVINDCGFCVNGNTGLTADEGKDCLGICGGSAVLDCNEVCGGGAVIDACGVCGGANDCWCDPLEVVSLTLMQAGNGGEIMPLTEGLVINLSQVGPFNVRADLCNGATVGSVKFKLNGSNYRIENTAPYALAGDNPTGYYKPWNPAVGTYTLSATAYSGSSASGIAGAIYPVTFEVVNYNGSRLMAGTNDVESGETKISVYPNPNQGSFNLEFTLKERKDLSVEIFNPLSQLIYADYRSGYEGEYNNKISFKDASSGLYYLRVKAGEKHWVEKIVVQ